MSKIANVIDVCQPSLQSDFMVEKRQKRIPIKLAETWLIGLLCCFTLSPAILAETQACRPNILWISLEDITPMMGCYGDTYARTPVFDRLAAEGIRYTMAHSVAPVCSTSRSSIITGMYPSTLGTMHHRSNTQPSRLAKMFPNYLKEAGYYTSNNYK